MNSNQWFVVASIIPFFFGMFAAIYAYLELSRNGIAPPSLWVATLVVALFAYIIGDICFMIVFLWRLLR